MKTFIIYLTLSFMGIGINFYAHNVYSKEDIFDHFDPETNLDTSGGSTDDVGEQWNESDYNLPSFPAEENLLEFPGVAAYKQYTYAIDENSISLSKEGIVRYTIVIQSASGSSNSYYQGISCNNREIRTYAYADSNTKRFIIYSTAKWERLKYSGSMGYSQGLADFYFCNSIGIVFPVNEIISKLKYQNKNDDNEIYD